MSHQRFPIHQKGLSLGENGAEAMENGEAMRIDIAPIVKLLALKPGHSSQGLHPVTQAEDHHAAGCIGEGEAIYLVFRYEYPINGEI